MPAISDITRSRISASLEVFIENYVEKHRGRAVRKWTVRNSISIYLIKMAA